jgi:hypothetical protein
MRVHRVSLGAKPRVRKPLKRVALASLDELGVPAMTTRTLRCALPPPLLAGIELPGRRTRATSR